MGDWKTTLKKAAKVGRYVPYLAPVLDAYFMYDDLIAKDNYSNRRLVDHLLEVIDPSILLPIARTAATRILEPSTGGATPAINMYSTSPAYIPSKKMPGDEKEPSMTFGEKYMISPTEVQNVVDSMTPTELAQLYWNLATGDEEAIKQKFQNKATKEILSYPPNVVNDIWFGTQRAIHNENSEVLPLDWREPAAIESMEVEKVKRDKDYEFGEGFSKGGKLKQYDDGGGIMNTNDLMSKLRTFKVPNVKQNWGFDYTSPLSNDATAFNTNLNTTTIPSTFGINAGTGTPSDYWANTTLGDNTERIVNTDKGGNTEHIVNTSTGEGEPKKPQLADIIYSALGLAYPATITGVYGKKANEVFNKQFMTPTELNLPIGAVRDLYKPSFALKYRAPGTADSQETNAMRLSDESRQQTAEQNYAMQNSASRLQQEQAIRQAAARKALAEAQMKQQAEQFNATINAQLGKEYRENALEGSEGIASTALDLINMLGLKNTYGMTSDLMRKVLAGDEDAIEKAKTYFNIV